MDIGYLIGKPMELADPPLLPTQLADVVLVSHCGLVVVVLVVVVAMADGIGDCG